MAALMRHGVFETARKVVNVAGAERRYRPGSVAQAFVSVRGFATKAEKKKGLDRKRPPTVDSSAQAIAAKGFLRPQQSYAPPENVDAKLDGIFRETVGTIGPDASLEDLAVKFELFTACAREFNHPVPNSILHKVETLNDVRNFYKTPVDTKTPLDKMRNMELPENLHVQFEYHRFHPETDTMFKGQTAFNRSSTLVTGLKYKDKYKGHTQNQTWPFNS